MKRLDGGSLSAVSFGASTIGSQRRTASSISFGGSILTTMGLPVREVRLMKCARHADHSSGASTIGS